MVRTYDLIKKESAEKSDSLRLSDFDELGIEAGETSSYKNPLDLYEKVDLEGARITYEAFQNFMHEVRERVKNNQRIELETALILIRKVLESTELFEGMYQLTTDFGNNEDGYISQPINTMIYAIKTGSRMGYTRDKLVELALAALLHNVGMFMIPEEILGKKDALSASELTLMKRHPEMGKNILYTFNKDFPWLVRAAQEHHERENGQGYPQGIKGDAIHEYAKIIGICDSYEAMTHNRPHKKAIMQFASVREIIETKNLLFSPKIIKIFLEVISIYPTGSCVKLNNMAICRVVATNPDQPLKPFVSILFDGQGNRVSEEKIINLKEHPVLTIVSGVSDEDLPQ